MIEFELFAYTNQQWDRIKVAVDALGLDADKIERRPLAASGLTAMQSLRERIEIAASVYLLQSANTRQRPRRAELIAVRENAENLSARIFDALAVQVGSKHDDTVRLVLRQSVDGDMETATRDYFAKLLQNLDREIEKANQRGDNARKADRDDYWNELLAIWCELGGKASGKAAASFLGAASKPVMGSAVPDITSVMRWLERRQSKAVANKIVTKKGPRPATR
ncbi:hypothetical protein [Bradyrhizobium sp. McL0616]|uniref:hypothetical protein n=1 Tax=Bradyrhizobium sp. McL0616 TaxID=3415674 RepID=UPI003CEA2E2E